VKVLLTGAKGMLATALIPELGGHGADVHALDRAELDVTDAAATMAAVADLRPDAVIQCAAYTSVDAAETDEERAFAVNAQGAGNVAEACQRFGSLFVYPSTDYVFSGVSTRPYPPEEPIRPLGVYGRSKAAGEVAALRAGRTLTVRTSWLYGAGGPNFVDTIVRISRERDRLEVVDDQVGRPTWTRTLAATIARLLKVGAVGTFHASDGGKAVSWYGFAEEILELCRRPVTLVRISSEALARPAPRPRYSVLDCTVTERVLGEPLPDWRDSLASYLTSVGAVAGGEERSR
jgi:dTDP-4-dehydrorhamnose reductase